MTTLLSALVYLIFMITNVIVGLCMYRLGLHGQLRRYMRMQDPIQDTTRPKEKEPSHIPGSEFFPQNNEPSDFWAGYDQEDPIEELPDPLTPYQGEANN